MKYQPRLVICHWEPCEHKHIKYNVLISKDMQKHVIAAVFCICK